MNITNVIFVQKQYPVTWIVLSINDQENMAEACHLVLRIQNTPVKSEHIYVILVTVESF